MDATYAQTSCLGGEWSKKAQGRFDVPVYRTAMNVCLNSLPIETGAWTRRSGTRHASVSRVGQKARLIKFDFLQNDPYTMALTDGFMRFYTGATPVMTNDQQAVSAISTASPAEVTTAGTHGWSTGNQVMFNSLGANNPLLHNRPFIVTVTGVQKFTLVDALTGQNIDGSTLGTFVSGNVTRIMEIATPFTEPTLEKIRSVQASLPASSVSSTAQATAILLEGTVKPQVLASLSLPSDSEFATFSLTAANFLDGPYLDPVSGGATITPSGKTGIVTMTVTFTAYDSTRAYAKGDFVSSSNVNYQSLIDQNLANTPASSPTAWAAVSSGVAVGPSGFVGSDIGRAIRLFSEPALWDSAHTYSTGDVATYNGVYYTALASTTGNQPDTSPTKWTLNPSAAVWTWGRITALSTLINSGSAIGDFTSFGGNSAAFDGSLSHTATASATKFAPSSAAGFYAYSGYVGQNDSGSPKAIGNVVITAPTDTGFVWSNFGYWVIPPTVQFYLYGSHTAPANDSDGTLLGSSAVIPLSQKTVQIASSDTTTTWEYRWVRAVGSFDFSPADFGRISISQVQFFSPNASAGASASIVVQLLGDNLLYTTPIRVWRLGAYSDTTGWPTCGCYHEGRIWLSGAIPNRIDGCYANGQSLINPEKINFAPTTNTGSVTDANAISYTFNSKDLNPIFWMEPDQQGIVCGTKAGEWLVQASALNSPLTPTSIQAHRVTKIGCADIEPRRSEHTLLFVQAHRRKLMEYFADVFSGKFSAPNLTEKAKHLTQIGIAEIAYQQELAPIVWARGDDGSLIGCTYKRDSLASSQGPTFAGWHRHTLGSGRTVESISVGPSQNGEIDGLTITTNDTVSNVRHIELLQDLFEEGGAMPDGWFLDDAITPTFSQNVTIAGVPCLQLGGLWPLNGSTVTAFIGGLDCGDHAVANGVMNVPYDTANALFTQAFVSGYVGTMPIVVGFAYNSDGQIVRPATPAESGARNGPALGKLRRTQIYAMQLVDAQGLSVGTSFASGSMNAALLETDGGARLTAQQLKTGVHRQTLTDSDSFDSMICWRVSRPFPATIAALAGFVQTKDA